MALNNLALSTTSGSYGSPFAATISGQAAGNRVYLANASRDGFFVVNGELRSLFVPAGQVNIGLGEVSPSGERKVTQVVLNGVFGSGAGGSSLDLSPSVIDPTATGAVAQLSSSLSGTVTYSKLSGASSIAIAASGAVTVSSALGANGTAAFVARAQNGAGDAVEKALSISASAVVTPTPTPTPTPALTLSGALSYAADAAAGTTVATIANVPAGVTPAISPADGRMVIGGDATSGWKVVKGMTASTAGTISITVSATGATSVTKDVTVSAAASTITPFYSLVSNRFQIGTDFGTGDTNTQNPAWKGGNGVEGQGRDHFRRWRVDLAKASTPGTPGIMPWANAIMTPGGMTDAGTSGMTITKVEIRKISDGSLITPVTFNGGSPTLTLTSGLIKFNDEITNAPAGEVFLDVYWKVALGSIWASCSRAFAEGEYSASSKTVDFATVGTPPSGSGRSSAVGGADFGPLGYFVKDTTAVPSLLINMDSTGDLTNYIEGLYDTKGNYSPVEQAMADPTNGKIAYFSASRYSTSAGGLTSAFNSGGGEVVAPFCDWIGKVFRDILGQTKSPFGGIYCGHGKNDINAGNTSQTIAANAASVVNNITKARARYRTYWPNIPFFQQTISPLSNDQNSMGFTSDALADQIANVPGADNAANNGWIEAVNNLIMANGTFDVAIDIAVVTRSPTNYRAWKVKGDYTSTVAAAFGTNATTVQLAAAPPLGAMITFSPGDATNMVRVGSVSKVTASTAVPGAFDVNFTGGRANQSVRVAKAQALGAVVKTSDTDGLHQSPRVGNEISGVIIPFKPQIRTLIANYIAAA